ncbi:PQQ-binding-like beta-propeller repeat protein [Brachybacterium paraconglomeratum]|uniref:PQQ-binding-like beta-propeller repeat protein n=1 Tax=Brachybacterium paraconglomeratum TaxID=173362 RepID=UPI00026C6BDC|nr:PQQ-binding-like beta-propeller repeat protein [Brachybacterium paraconglomeratum]
MSEDQAPAGEHAPDAATALGLAVVLLALAGISALLGGHFLLGVLRLAAGVLAGAGLGVLLIALLGGRLRRRTRTLLAAGLALVVALALTVPAVLATRVDSLGSAAAAEIAPLGEGDTVASAPGGQGPVLVRRADGTAQLLDAATGVHEVEASPGGVLALSVDGTRLVQVSGEVTQVHELGGDGSDGSAAPVELPGQPLALDGDVLVLRACEDGVCRVRGIDLTAPDEPLWTVMDAEETRGPDQAGLALPARAEAPPGLLDAVAATGVLPSVPLRFDPAQGWLQIDASTGFPVGRVLAPADADCRIAATPAPPDPQSVQEQGPLVLTVCAGEDGALTAAAFRDGAPLWESAPSPAGDWTVRLEAGRVLASGTEAGTTTEGEILASEHGADWIAPGGDGVAQAEAFTARIGIDGTRMVLTNEAGQLLAYDTATGTNSWTLPLDDPDSEVRGGLASGTAVVLDETVREEPLDPRGAQRLRVITAEDGEVSEELVLDEEITAWHPLSGGRALISTDEGTVLLGG